MVEPAPINENESVFLIVDGKRVVMLDQPVTNIGRKRENHVVIDNLHVSRFHAQIRKIKGRYILMDLDSTVGTSVNGKPVKQTFLKAGDVISFGGVPVIFGVGTPKAALEAASGPHEASSGPTDTTELREADAYLDFFNTPDDEP